MRLKQPLWQYLQNNKVEDREDMEDTDLASLSFVTLARPHGSTTLRMPSSLLVIEASANSGES